MDNAKRYFHKFRYPFLFICRIRFKTRYRETTSILLNIVSEKELNKRQKSLYRVKDFIQEMKKENLDYENKIRAKINIHLSHSNIDCIVIPDIKKLNEIYGVLRNLLHLRDSSYNYIEEDTELNKIEEIVLSSYEYLEQFKKFNLGKILNKANN